LAPLSLSSAVGSVPRLSRADLGELIVRPPAAEGQLRIRPCRERQQQAGRPTIDEEGHRPCHRRAFSKVIILQDQDNIAGILVEFLDQDRKDIGPQPPGSPAQRRKRLPADGGVISDKAESRSVPEPGRLGVSASGVTQA
jgi:hypothetical protein